MDNARASRTRPSITQGVTVVLLFVLVAAVYVFGFVRLSLPAYLHVGTIKPIGDFGCDYDDNSGPITHVDPGGAAALAGLKVGDRIDLDAMAPEYQRDVDWHETSLPGKRSEWHILRGGKSFVVLLVSQPHFVDADSMFWHTVQRCIALLSFIVGSFLFLYRPSKMMLGFYLFCLSLTAWEIPFLFMHGSWLIATHIVRTILRMEGAVGLLIFALRFPQGVATGWRRRVDTLSPFLYTGGAALSIASSVSHRALSEPVNPAWEITLYAIFALAVAAFIATLISSMSASEQNQAIRWAIAACIVGSAGIPLNLLLDMHLDAPEWLGHAGHMVLVLIPIAAAYGVLSSAREELVPTPARPTT